MQTETNQPTPQILPDSFTFYGVCPFCRTRQMVHDESGLCKPCLAAARRGFNPIGARS